MSYKSADPSFRELTNYDIVCLTETWTCDTSDIIYIYNLFISSFLTKHKKQYIKFDTKNTAIKTRIHNQDKT